MKLRNALLPLVLALGVTAVSLPVVAAAPVLTNSELDVYADVFGDPDCTLSHVASPYVQNAIVVENGPPTVASTAVSGMQTLTADPTDVVRFEGSWRTSTSARSVGTDVRHLALGVTGRAAVTTTKPVAGCRVEVDHEVDVEYDFVLARPTFVTASVSAGARTTAVFYIDSDEDSTFSFELEGTGPRYSQATTIFLPAGGYEAVLYGDTYLRGQKAIGPTPVHADVQVGFADVGSLVGTVRGSARRHVSLPTARSCTKGSLSVGVTRNAKRAAAIRDVRLVVNGRVAAKVTDPKATRQLKARIPAEAAADVRVVVRLDPKRGKTGKTLAATADYLPCAG
jgi:hypothetical protein